MHEVRIGTNCRTRYMICVAAAVRSVVTNTITVATSGVENIMMFSKISHFFRYFYISDIFDKIYRK